MKRLLIASTVLVGTISAWAFNAAEFKFTDGQQKENVYHCSNGNSYGVVVHTPTPSHHRIAPFWEVDAFCSVDLARKATNSEADLEACRAEGDEGEIPQLSFCLNEFMKKNPLRGTYYNSAFVINQGREAAPVEVANTTEADAIQKHLFSTDVSAIEICKYNLVSVDCATNGNNKLDLNEYACLYKNLYKKAADKYTHMDNSVCMQGLSKHFAAYEALVNIRPTTDQQEPVDSVTVNN